MVHYPKILEDTIKGLRVENSELKLKAINCVCRGGTVYKDHQREDNHTLHSPEDCIEEAEGTMERDP